MCWQVLQLSRNSAVVLLLLGRNKAKNLTAFIIKENFSASADQETSLSEFELVVSSCALHLEGAG